MRNAKILITQRSGVQIPPPQPTETLANTGLSLVRRDGYWYVSRTFSPPVASTNTQQTQTAHVEGGHQPVGTLTVHAGGQTYPVTEAELVSACA